MRYSRQSRPSAGREVRRSASANRSASGDDLRCGRDRRRVAVEKLEDRTLLAADVVISEFMASNDSTLADSYGAYSDWIEVYNRGDAAQDLDGFFLTDSGSDLTQWRFPAVSLPAGGYLTIFASGRGNAVAGAELHTTFQLDAGGEYLALVRPDGLTVQHAFAPAYPNQDKDISYGLSFDNVVGNYEEQPFSQPTPGAANIANAPAPVFSVAGRTFATTFNLALSTPLAGAQIRYTTNRTVPTAASSLYTGPISIAGSTIVRAQTFASGRAPSPVASETYLALDASVQNFNSNLPVVVLDTFGAGVADSPQTMVGSVIIDTAAGDGRASIQGAPDFAGRAGLNVRGQSSAGFEKKQYHFEIWDEANQDKGESLLGMPNESDWVLYAPYSEKTLMQNYLAYEWSNRIGQYAVRSRFVEVFVNGTAGSKIDYAGDYKGVYILMEKIKIDDDRVDVAKLGPTDNAEPDVTGGYIFKKDKPDPGEVGFNAGGNSFRYEDPSAADITPAQKTYLSNYLNEFYSVLNGPNFADPVNGYAKYIDVDSFIEHHIIVEMTKNIDGFRISTFYSKDRNGKIKMGPVWDYNLSLGNADYLNGWIPTGWYSDMLSDGDYPWFRRLFQDPNFQQKYIDRWQELRRDELSTTRLMADFDALTNLLSDGNGNYPTGANPVQTPTNPVVRNYTKWKILGVDTWPNWYTDPSWIKQVNWTKNWLSQRVDWWDKLYLPQPEITPAGGAVSSPTQVTITSKQTQTSTDTTLLFAGAAARAIVPTGDIGTTWRNRTGFDDSAWISGTTGAGYDEDITGVNYLPLIGLPVTMRNVNPTVYVRVPFNLANPATVSSLYLNMKYDDAFVAYLNGTEIARTSNAPAALGWNASATGSRDDPLAVNFEGFDVTAFKNLLVSGTNVLAIQGLNNGVGSSDLLIVPELVSRTLTTTTVPVYYTTDGTDPRLPNGNVSPSAQLYSAPFTVSTTALVMARTRSGGKWSGPASALYDFGENRLRISEVMYNPAPPPAGGPYLPSDFEYVELVNTGTQPMNLSGSRFTSGISFTFGNYTLSAGARVLVVRNPAAFESRYGAGKPIAGTFTGALNDGGERVKLLGRFGETVHDFTYSDGWYPQTDGQGWSLTAVDPAAAPIAWTTKSGWRASEPFNGTPGAADIGLRPNAVVINEIMSNPISGGDWIELRNTTTAAISLADWWLSDTAGNLKKWRIPAGSTLPSSGYLVFAESQFGSAFSFSASGEGVYLSSGDASGNVGGYRVDEVFLAADPGVTFGRTPVSGGGADFTALVSPTQGAANAAPVIGPVVINEIMYHPQTGKAEFIELRNITGSAVSLFDPADADDTWKFSGAVDWAFPTGVSIPANGYVIVAAVDPALFRSQYGVPAAVQVFGPYTLPNGTNVLSNNGESIRLLRPGGSPTANPRPFVSVDRVAYDDASPWPAETNGTGQSLGRIDPAAYGNDPVNWAAELFGGSPGRPNLDNSPPTLDVIDVTPDPRTAPVASMTLLFSEAVAGVDLADLRFSRNGSNIPLTASQTLISTDGGIAWMLGNLGTLTSAAGAYVLTVVAAGSGIADAGGRALSADASDAWVTNPSDTSAPSGDITDITPDPRNTDIVSATVVFSEPVTGVDWTDFTLTRDGGANLFTSGLGRNVVSSDGGIIWIISPLSHDTARDGVYVLTLKSTGTGIADLAGNPLAGGATDAWLVDATRPTATIVAITPDPRSTPVESVTINFSEPVTGFDLADLRLTQDGGANLLTAAQTLTTPDGGATWRLGNLADLTATSGNYSVTLITAGSDIADAVGNTLSTVDAADAWSIDAVAPTANIVDVSPDPREAPVDAITITFSEPITGFDRLDLQLVRDNDGTNLLTAAQTLTTADGGITWTLGNLASLTADTGSYTLTLVSARSGVSDAAGNSLQSDAAESWTVTPVASPGIISVYVRGSTWAGPDADPANVTFKEYLEVKGLGDEVYGYRADNVTTTLPWINLNQIVLQFAGLIDATLLRFGSIFLEGQHSDYKVITGAQVDAESVVLTLDRPLGIQPAGSPDIHLGDRIRLFIPGGRGEGIDYDQMLNVLQGDADRAANTRVATTDVNFTKARLNRTSSEVPPAGAAYTAFADLNGDGRILTADINAAKARLNDVLPAPLVASVAGVESSDPLAAPSVNDELFGTTPILA